MARHYCDTKVMEQNWFNWLLSEAAPDLEPYRKEGILWTKLIGSNNAYQCKTRIHCLQRERILLHVTEEGKSRVICDINDPDIQGDPEWLTAQGFIRELPSQESWDLLISDINKMCVGIAYTFNMREDEYADLSSDAIVCVIGKLRAKKLVYIPGQAPVFNLLTTAIKRICISQLSKRTKRARDTIKLLEDVERGAIPDSFKSVKHQRIR